MGNTSSHLIHHFNRWERRFHTTHVIFPYCRFCRLAIRETDNQANVGTAIIKLLAAKGVPRHEIARCLGTHAKIVKKYVQMRNLSPRPSACLSHTGDRRICAVIDSWLGTNLTKDVQQHFKQQIPFNTQVASSDIAHYPPKEGAHIT